MAADTNGEAFVVEGLVATSGSGMSVVMVGQQLDRIRSAALQIVDAAEILRGFSPTTAEMRAEWRKLRRKGAT